MTRSSQQPPASPEARAESGAAAVNSGAGVVPGDPGASGAANSANSAPAPVPAKNGSAVAPEAPEVPEAEVAGAAEKAGEPDGPEAAGKAAGAGSAESGADGPSSEARAGTPEADPAADPDPSAAAAQSRLPALVRTMTATAIDRPQQQAGPVGRPGKAVLAGAAVAGALLVSVPFLVLAGNDDKGPQQPSTAAAGTVLDGSGPEAPGEFAVTAPETSSPGDGAKGGGEPDKARKSAESVPQVPLPAPVSGSGTGADAPKTDDGAPKDPPKKAGSPEPQPKKASGGTAPSAEKKSGGAKKESAKAAPAAPAVTFSGPVSFRSHLSGRCLDVPGHNFNDGQRLFMWDCNGAEAQKWRFGSDGTIRAKDKCLDVANANFNDGTPIQLAWCNGSAAQKFTLNAAHDLVNTVVGKCVDIPNHSRGRGPETYLILWTCTGLDNQKWSV
ncbi:ricin-type beta-trefoil lectin domain protein [Streptomyces arboris]|uniref:ricin-type beta-trefoil lectin domain protein n=1 Tax=Streptomyces arboris TaxID=2600619 RepID=UPI003C3093A2